MVLGSFSAHATHYYDKKPNMSYLNKICIVFQKPSDQSHWGDGLSLAVQRYNQFFSSNPDVSFTSGYPSGCSHYIELRSKRLGYNHYFALEADKVSSWSRRPGDWIMINTDRENDYSSRDLRAGILMHEIGHTLGLKHTNDGAGTAIPNTNNDSYAYASVFLPEDHIEPIQQPTIPVLTNFDKRALEFLVNQ